MVDECNDKKCFQHSNVHVRGGILYGKVISTKGKKTAIIERTRAKNISKYQRWAKERSKLPAHNPPCINAQVGDFVEISETRRLSKTKAWTITKVLKKGEAI